MLIEVLQAVLVCGSAWCLWKLFRYHLVKSDLDNIPGPPSPSFFSGHLKQLRDTQYGWTFHRELAEKYDTVARLRGTFGRDLLFVHDPKAMHHIAVKDIDIFEQPKWLTSTTSRNFGKGLFASHGDHHRKQRKMLNPAFSINHMREMMPIFQKVTHKLREAIESRVSGGPADIDMVGWMGRTALELVGQAGLGYSFDPLVQDKTDAFGEALKSLMPTLSSLGPLVHFFPLCETIVPQRWLRPLGKLVPIKGIHRMIEISDTMHEKSSEIFHQKKMALMQGDEAIKQQVGEGKDIMSLLLKANMASSVEDQLPEEELLAQMSTLTFAAMDTTSNALSLTLWLLAQHQHVQEKLRQEIVQAQAASGNSDIGYDELVSLPYLDAVCRETLRVHVPAPLRFREARKDVLVPLSQPIRGRDGKMIHQILVPKDTTVFVSITSSNTNPAIWGPDAQEWKPERWLAPLPETVHDAKIPGVYSNLMTFWAGGRSCIGFKFSQLEMKVVLAILLSTFTFEMSDKPIFWNLSGVVYPSTTVRDGKPEMPMKVALVKSRSSNLKAV